jgi:hypothetical protein
MWRPGRTWTCWYPGSRRRRCSPLQYRVCRSRSSRSEVSPVTGASASRRPSSLAPQITAPHEPWIAADQFNGGFRVLVTGPHGFERTVTFAIDDDPAVIAERVRATMEE